MRRLVCNRALVRNREFILLKYKIISRLFHDQLINWALVGNSPTKIAQISEVISKQVINFWNGGSRINLIDLCDIEYAIKYKINAQPLLRRAQTDKSPVTKKRKTSSRTKILQRLHWFDNGVRFSWRRNSAQTARYQWYIPDNARKKTISMRRDPLWLYVPIFGGISDGRRRSLFSVHCHAIKLRTYIIGVYLY